MPIIEAHLLEGYPSEAKARLAAALTDAVRFVVPAPDEAITVMMHEYPADNYARGGQTRSAAPPLPDPRDLVRAFLNAMEARNLDSAGAMLAPDFSMTFPGGVDMTSLPELVAWARDRYRFVTKTYDGMDAFHSGGSAIVYASGTLAGEWPDGRAFSGIRFIDRFEIVAGLIRRQEVWNDLAEVRPK